MKRSRRPSVLGLAAPRFDESERRQADTAFTPVLRTLWNSSRAICSVVFVDAEGECVDFCTSVDPYDAKIAGAQLRFTLDQVSRFAAKIEAGRVSSFEIRARNHDLLVRYVGEGYALIVVVQGQLDQWISLSTEEAAIALQAEASMHPPAWDPGSPGVIVSTRPALGWEIAPVQFRHEGRTNAVVDVLGAWEEHGALSQDTLLCFRVRLDDGRELTLAMDRLEGRWMIW